MISRNYKVIDMTTNHPFDLLLNNNVRIDVKASHLYEGKLGKFYAFNLERKYHDCDIFFLRCINNQGEYRDLIIPVSRVMGQKQISVGENKSKWYAYENRYDLIDKYIGFYEDLAKQTT